MYYTESLPDDEIVLNVMYSNIQGFTGKKTCLGYTINSMNADVVLLAETMCRKVEMNGCHCICPKKSVGQNVAVLLCGKVCAPNKMKLYEPNEVVNMIGVRVELYGFGLRFYTAHLKQQSTTSRADFACQFDEIKNQARSANAGREPWLLVFDANVHVGGEVIDGCEDKQDWGGKKLLEMVNDEGLTIVNSLDLCHGIVTRVDPRNGTESSIDLALCNTFMLQYVVEMEIDEDEKWKMKKYGKKVTQTDHNTIKVQLKFKRNGSNNTEVTTRYNLKNDEAKVRMQENIMADMDPE